MEFGQVNNMRTVMPIMDKIVRKIQILTSISLKQMISLQKNTVTSSQVRFSLMNCPIKVVLLLAIVNEFKDQEVVS